MVPRLLCQDSPQEDSYWPFVVLVSDFLPCCRDNLPSLN